MPYPDKNLNTTDIEDPATKDAFRQLAKLLENMQRALTSVEDIKVAALLNAWVDFSTALNGATGYWKDGMQTVHLQGLLKTGTIGLPMFTLPVGYRPAKTLQFAIITNPDVAGRLKIDPNGDVTPLSGSNVYYSISGITFRAEQ